MGERSGTRQPTEHPGIFHLEPSQRFAKGGWLVRWRSPDGSQHRKTFHTKKEAISFRESTRTDIRRGVYADDKKGRTPLATVAEHWYSTLSGLRAKTVAGYRAILDMHILPKLGHREIGSIKPSEVAAFLASRGKAASTRHNILSVLGPVMEQAVDDGLIASNPCKTKTVRAQLGPSDERERLYLKEAEVAVLADAIDPAFRTFLLTAAYTGMREGELHALRVRRVDLLERQINVAESVSVLDGKDVFNPPKTKNGKRTIRIPTFLANLLAEQIGERKGDAFVFSRDNGDPLRHDDYYRKHFKKAVKAALSDDKQGLRFHDLRHTHASLLIKQGEHPKAVMARLGHASISITMDRYGHLYEDHDVEMVEKIEASYQVAAGSSAKVVPIRK